MSVRNHRRRLGMREAQKVSTLLVRGTGLLFTTLTPTDAARPQLQGRTYGAFQTRPARAGCSPSSTVQSRMPVLLRLAALLQQRRQK